MSRPPARRASVKTGRKPQRAKRPGLIDRTIAALPISETTIHKVTSWGITGAVLALALGIATWLGVPGIIGTAVAEGVGQAGFRLEHIEITGLKRADKMRVYFVALDQKSRAMPLVDLSKVREELLSEGWIADARVSRRLPDTLVINVVEREPAAVWQYQGQLMLIDAKGVLLEPVSADAMPDLPLVIGNGANEQEEAYRRLIEAAPALKPMVKAATWIGNRRWDLTFESGERLSLPEGEREAAKALIKFAELDGARRLLGRGYLKFDMRDPARLVLRLPDHTEREAITGEQVGG